MSARTSIGTCPALCAASTTNGTAHSRAIRPISRIGWIVPVTLLAWVIAINFVSGRIARRMSSGSTSPVAGSTGTRVCSIRPASASALYGRRIELWSMCVQIAWDFSPGRISPLMARFSASEQLSVKTTWFGSSPLSSVLIARRHSAISPPVSIASAYAPRPALAPNSFAYRTIASVTARRLRETRRGVV